MKSLTYGEGRSVLPTSIGFGSLAASRGGSTGILDGVRRSGRVMGDLAEARE